MDLDLNADVGEGAATDGELISLVTSANVSCGFHAGDPESIRKAILFAKHFKTAVGAHPGFPDRANFGREEQVFARAAEAELAYHLHYQVGALVAYAKLFRVRVKYVKPHGALYNQAARGEFAAAVLAVAGRFELPLVGLAGSKLEKLAARQGVKFVREGFADRRYANDGSLVPRSEADAVLTDVQEVAAQVKALAGRKKVETVCFHGDTPQAVAFASAVRQALAAGGFQLKAFA